MKHFKFKITADFEEAIDNIISCILPHENFDLEEAKSVIEEFSRTLPTAETTGAYFIFMKILERLSVTRLYLRNHISSLSRDVFEQAVMGGLRDIVLLDDFDSMTFFGSYGRNFDLSVPTQFEDAVSFAYSVLMEKYDELFAKAIPTEQGLAWITVLKQQMEYALTAKTLDLAATILTQGITQERRLIRGPEAARKFITDAIADVNARIETIFSERGNRFVETNITSLNASKLFDEKNNLETRDLYYMGIDPIDDVMPVRTQDIITIVADEGIGKTRFAIDQAYRALTSGNNVLYICGETAQKKIKKMIESMHCFNLYQIQLKWTEVEHPEKIAGMTEDQLEDTIVKINAALADLYENPKYGTPIFLQSACYESFAETIRSQNEKYNIDLVIVDHALALDSDGSYTTMGHLNTKQMRVSHLYTCEDKLVKECNLAFLNTIHPSVQTSSDLKAGKAPGPRSGAESSDSTKYSSLVAVLNNNPELRKQDIVLMYLTKLRDEPNTADACVLKRLGYSNIHVFDPKLQYIGSSGKSNTSDEELTLLLEDMEDE